ncbi:glycosyltransferase family 4 protein [Azonexus hydrophilus]|uniref:Glycosyltransferase family 4 protein n=1 Tax=Azonexus hydrophilus TaxID=418702 RepID=A0ABZ2XDC7_9RHOO
MKIMYVNSFYAPNILGGAEVTLQALVEGMSKFGHDVVVVATGDNPGILEESVNGIRVLRVGIDNYYWGYSKEKKPKIKRFLWHCKDAFNTRMADNLQKIVASEKPDLLSSHNLAGWSSLVLEKIKSKEGVPIVQVLHDYYNLCPKNTMYNKNSPCKKQCLACKVLRIRSKKYSESVDAVIGVSRFVLDEHLKYGYFKNVKIATAIHNVRSQNYLINAGGKEDRNGALRIGFIGALSREKGIEFLIDSFSSIKSNIGNVELHIAGIGDSEYEKYLKLKAGPSVFFLGQLRPSEFYKRIDLLVVPSLWNEPLGMVVPEAFRCGVPVIGSVMGGIPEMINSGVNGFLFDPRIDNDLVRVVCDAVSQPALLESVRTNCLKSSDGYFDVDAWLGKYNNIYNKVLCEEM